MGLTVRFLVALSLCVFSAIPAFAQKRTYKVLATNKTSTMERELRDAGAQGFRFVDVMGGDTEGGGQEVVVVMERRDGDATKYEYRLLATSRTSTLEKEMQDAAATGFNVVGQTVFNSTFGGAESSAILEKGVSTADRYEYRLIATSRTSTLEKELQQAADQGYEAMELTVGKTALGGSELVVIARKLKLR